MSSRFRIVGSFIGDGSQAIHAREPDPAVGEPLNTPFNRNSHKVPTRYLLDSGNRCLLSSRGGNGAKTRNWKTTGDNRRLAACPDVALSHVPLRHGRTGVNLRRRAPAKCPRSKLCRTSDRSVEGTVAHFTAGSTVVRAVIDKDSPTAHSVVDMLPMNLLFSDFGGEKKVSSPPRPFDFTGLRE